MRVSTLTARVLIEGSDDDGAPGDGWSKRQHAATSAHRAPTRNSPADRSGIQWHGQGRRVEIAHRALRSRAFLRHDPQRYGRTRIDGARAALAYLRRPRADGGGLPLFRASLDGTAVASF